jgi:dTDP-4-dehydrorhamnose 3,5-epimerase-like enzyme
MPRFDDKKYAVIELKEFGDDRGNLVVAEGSGFDIPFDIRRVFYMYGSDPDIKRGNHANRYTKFVLINVSGSSKVLVDDGEKKEVIVLDKPRMGLYLGPMVWKEMYDFSPDSVLLVLASEHYIDNEYIRDYDAFIKEIKGLNE